jgi:hypothetical protein
MIVSLALLRRQAISFTTRSFGVQVWNCGFSLSKQRIVENNPYLNRIFSVRALSHPSHTHAESTKSAPWEATSIPAVSNPQTWLVVGDGDLSYSAHLASTLNTTTDDPVQFIASVWEDQETHHSVYQHSQRNTRAIQESGQIVSFGIDATQLHRTFPKHSLDRIIFHFPHWKGKSNIRHNRKLIQEFLVSATFVVKAHGAIHMALVHGQGGHEAHTIEAWHQSWKAAEYAAEAGLVLQRITPFTIVYTVSSHRGVDRPFAAGLQPQLYIFGPPRNGDDTVVDPCWQMACRHEVRIELNREHLGRHQYTSDDLINGTLLSILQEIVPPGIAIDIPIWDIVHRKSESSTPLLVFLIVYSGERQVLTRQIADSIRAQVERHLVEDLDIHLAKRGRMVSRLFPLHLLPSLIRPIDKSQWSTAIQAA